MNHFVGLQILDLPSTLEEFRSKVLFDKITFTFSVSFRKHGFPTIIFAVLEKSMQLRQNSTFSVNFFFALMDTIFISLNTFFYSASFKHQDEKHQFFG